MQGGAWYGDNLSSPNYRENLIYDYKGYKPPHNGWRYDKTSMERLDREGLLYFPEDRKQRIQFKRYLKNTETQTPKSVFYIDRRAASKELEALMGAEVFDFPKSTKLLHRLLATVDSSNSIVLDFFCGSGTTAHSVMQLNAEDGGTRRFVVVQLPEPCLPASVAHSAGYRDIADIAKERIRRAGAKIKAENATTAPNLDIGFRVLKIDTSNMKDVYYTPDAVKQDQLELLTDNIKVDRKPEDLLFQVLVDWGVDLALPITQETIAKKKVFFVDGNALAACFDPNITEELVKELAKKKPLRAVFRDSSYGSDSVKINVEQIFKLLSPGTELKSL